MPKVDGFNQIVTIDLKQFDKNDPNRRYICYLVDMHTRLTAAKFIPNKEPKQIYYYGEVGRSWLRLNARASYGYRRRDVK